ncbi:MAG: cyclic nucleotide-binding domain-containing protein [Bacteroidota bacterium]
MIEILSLYHPIPAVEQQYFRSLTQSSTFKKGDYLLFDGEVQEELYLIKSGVAYLFLELEHRNKVIDFAYHNRFCADLASLSTQTPAQYCIQCLEDSEVERISFQY